VGRAAFLGGQCCLTVTEAGYGEPINRPSGSRAEGSGEWPKLRAKYRRGNRGDVPRTASLSGDSGRFG
jgi:hypothetical protein